MRIWRNGNKSMTIRGKDKNSPPFHDDKHHIDKKMEKQMLKNT